MAKRDQNRITTIMGASNLDGITPINICAENNVLCVSDGTTGTDYGVANAVRDENRVPVMMAVSSVDGVTPVELYADSNNKLLIKTT